MYGLDINGINTNVITNGINNIGSNSSKVANKNDTKVEFSDVMKDAIYKVNDSQVNANNKIESFIKGEDVTMHEVMLSMQESQMSMQLMIEVRNKMFEAYQEVNRVQL